MERATLVFSAHVIIIIRQSTARIGGGSGLTLTLLTLSYKRSIGANLTWVDDAAKYLQAWLQLPFFPFW